MDLISLNKTKTADANTGEPVEGISLALELDSGVVRTYDLPVTSSRYKRTMEVAGVLWSPDSTEDERDKALSALAAMFDIERRLQQKFRILASDTQKPFKIGSSSIYYDVHKLPKQIEDHIRKLLNESTANGDHERRNWKAFAKFVERLYSGDTDDYVREQLYSWIEAVQKRSTGFTLTEDGSILGHKGCGRDGENGVPYSIASGHAFVESTDESGEITVDEYKSARIPNAVGTIVRMPIHEVTNDPSIGCSAGLHVGTREYAEGWAQGILLAVKFGPEHVVSVPTECEAQKIRVSQYEVLEEAEVYGSTFYENEDEDYDDEYPYEDDEDECCEACYNY